MQSDYTPSSEDLDRFWSRVDKSGGPDACWLWTAGTHTRGYGRIRWGGKAQSAHRISWTLANGPIGADLYVCHKCDNPLCCNPSHFFLGTASDNMSDRDEKGRCNSGGYGKAEQPDKPPARPPRSLPSELRREVKALKAEIERLNTIIAELQVK